MTTKSRGELEGPGNVTCPTCGDSMPHGGDGRIVHCEGSNAAFGALHLLTHHARIKYPRCWHCNADMGCPRCAGMLRRELLCLGEPDGRSFAKRHDGLGPVWATREAFEEHGALLTYGQTEMTYPWGKQRLDLAN